MEIETVKNDVGMSWEMVKLSNVAEIIAGQSPESKYYNDKGEGIPFFQGKADFRIDYPIVRYWCTQPTKIAKPMDILMSVRAPVGPTNICDIEACIGRGLAAIRAGDKLHYKYLYFYFKTIEEKLASQGNGSTFSAITTSVIKDLQIPLPPLPIQRRIAEILDAADALKRKDQQLLKKYDELAQAIFMDMFGDPVKNEKGWEMKTIKSSTNTITYGLTVRPQYIEEGIPLISARELRNGFVNFGIAPKISIPEFKKLSNKCKPQKGDILFSKTGSIGLSAIVDKSVDFAVTQNAARINFKNEFYEINFIYSLLRQESFINKCITLVKGNAVKDLQLGDFSEIEIICPPLELQIKFSEMSIKTKNLIHKSEICSKGSDNLFQTLLQKAFKGELVAA